MKAKQTLGLGEDVDRFLGAVADLRETRIEAERAMKSGDEGRIRRALLSLELAKEAARAAQEQAG